MRERKGHHFAGVDAAARPMEHDGPMTLSNTGEFDRDALTGTEAKASSYLHAVAATAALGGLLYGFALAVIAGAEPFITRRFRLGSEEIGLIVSNLDLGAAAGALLAGALADKLGRRKVLAATALFFLLSAVSTACARSVAGLLAGRLVAGLAVGASVIVPLYIAEISPARNRGFLVSLVQMAIVSGILLAYITGWLLVDAGASSWRWMFAAGILPSAVFFAGAFFLPESPRWLVGRGRREAALAVLSRLGGAPGAEAALAEIGEALAAEKGDWREMLRPGLRRALAIGVSVAIFSVSVGINAVIFYGPRILREGGEDSVSEALLGSVILGAVNFAFSIAALFLVDRLGRKPLLLWGLGGMCAAMVAIGISFNPDGGKGVLLSILAFVAFYAVSLGPVTWVIVSEIFPTRARGAAAAACMVVMYLADFAVTLAFPSVMERLGKGAFYLFAAICAGAAIFILALVPETKGKSLEEIESMWARRERAGAEAARRSP